jgi:hypothetical protein
MMSKKAPEPALLEIEAQVVDLRKSGMTWEGIANLTGYANASGAYRAYQRAAERMVRPNLEEHRDIELERLDRIQAGLWDKAITGDTRAVDSLLRVFDRRARLLGLDAPTNLNVKAQVETYDRNSIDTAVAELAALLAGGQTDIVDASTGTA